MEARLSSDDRIRDWGLGIGFGTQIAYAIREKKPFVQCAYDGLRPTAQLTNGSLASLGVFRLDV